MKLSEFKIGEEFTMGEHRLRCTDIGTRVIVAIKVSPVNIIRDGKKIILTHEEAEAEGWFNGPPYAVVEYVFDEDGQEICEP
jgi:hypothetical protein